LVLITQTYHDARSTERHICWIFGTTPWTGNETSSRPLLHTEYKQKDDYHHISPRYEVFKVNVGTNPCFRPHHSIQHHPTIPQDAGYAPKYVSCVERTNVLIHGGNKHPAVHIHTSSDVNNTQASFGQNVSLLTQKHQECSSSERPFLYNLPYIKHRCCSPSTENTSGALGGLVPSLRVTI